MQSLDIRTTQNVAISYAPAGLGDRIGAFLIDSLLIGAYILATGYGLGESGVGSMWIFGLFFLPAFFYHLICEIFFNGQSVGKKQLNIKVVRLDGTPATIGGYILRWILRPIDISLFSGAVAIVCIVVSSKNQRLGDMAGGTTVVKIEARKPVTSHQVISNLQKDENYVVSFPEVRKLTDEQIRLVEEAIRANKLHANSQPAQELTIKIKSHLNIDSDMPPIKFLYTVVRDYNYVTSA